MGYDISKTVHVAPYQGATIGPVVTTTQVKVDVSTLTIAEVDRTGKIKPGTPLDKTGKRLTGALGEYVFGVVLEATKVTAPNPTNAILAAQTNGAFATVARITQIDRDACEANLGRVYTAAEITGFENGGCKLALSRF